MIVAHLAFVGVVALAQGKGAADVYRRAKGAVVTVRTESSSGTGFVIEDGRIVVTAYHVVKDDWFKGVTIDAGEGKIEARFIGGDADKDVAVLEIKRPIKKRLSLRTSTPAPGTRVFVIGNALGFLESTITEGIVSGLRKAGGNAYLQISAAVSPGNSGGPVLDENGNVVGLVKGSIVEGQVLNFAVASYVVRQVVDRLESHDLAFEMRVSNYTPDAPKRTEKVVIGRLGEVKAAGSIYGKRSTRAKVLADVSAGYTLVVRSIEGRWMTIVMNDHRLGYMESRTVKILPYEYLEERSKAKALDGTPSSFGYGSP